MEDLLAARLQMAFSLGFHIVFAVVGMAMPLFMVGAEWRYTKTGDPVYLDLAKRWAKGTAILFAVGAVSGTVLSFELGLLWPHFMQHAGPLIGMPFSLEGFAFFLEAIFLGVYLYGWDRVSRRAHMAAGLVVAASGLASGVFVVAVNAWMNTPVGFTVREGRFENLDLAEAFFSPAFFTQALHMSLAAYASVAFLVLGIHAWGLKKNPRSELHRRAAAMALVAATVATPLQILSGDLSAKHIAEYQPVKLAAAEAHFETARGAAIVLGGIVDRDEKKVDWAIRVPRLLSFLATGSLDGEVRGLTDFPEVDWPPIGVVHAAFEIMVGAGFAMLMLVLYGLYARWRGPPPLERRGFLNAAILAAPLGLIAVEAGWVVTEVGRQPWIISGVMRTAEAVTPMPHLVVPFLVFTALYIALSIIVVLLLRAHVLSADTPPAARETEAAG